MNSRDVADRREPMDRERAVPTPRRSDSLALMPSRADAQPFLRALIIPSFGLPTDDLGSPPSRLADE
jgi:hypothetical protein